MLAKIVAGANVGISSRLVNVECDISNSLPGFLVVGLGDKAVDEAKERVRGALKNSGLVVPPKRITMNLAPADLPKDGSGYDLAMAVGLLAASGQVGLPNGALFAGELALDGSLRPIPGALNYARLAADSSLKELYLPSQNAPEAALVEGVDIFAVDSLNQLYRHLIGEEKLLPYSQSSLPAGKRTESSDLELIYGQDEAKRALEIAAAGGHNLLLSGPPGAGKTMLAKALAGILPPPSLPEMIEVTQIHSLAGRSSGTVITERPFRSPHHTSSDVALIGGGRSPRPGEISLSHNGVLFLDELPEFPRAVLEVLRQPLEDGQVTISRATGSVTYPAKFMLIATQNPCPCGYAGDSLKECTCSQAQISNYNRRVSGPLLDRIDLVVNVNRVQPDKLTAAKGSVTTAEVATRVELARKRQAERFGNDYQSNSQLTNEQIKRFCALDEAASQLAREALIKLGLSARAYQRTLKVARTIADLESSSGINSLHLAEALQYRIRV